MIDASGLSTLTERLSKFCQSQLLVLSTPSLRTVSEALRGTLLAAV